MGGARFQPGGVSAASVVSRMALKSRPSPSIVVYACIGVFCLLSSAAGQFTCTNRFISEANLTVLLPSSDNPRLTPEYGEQRVIPNIAFTCNGTIIKWIVGADWRDNGQRSNFPHLQIWRNISATSYILVNSTIFSAAVKSSNEIYEFTPNPPLGFQAGDVLGIFQPREQSSRLRIYHEQDTGSINYFVSTANQPPSTNFSTATASSEMTRPLVTVEIELLRTTSLIFHPSLTSAVIVSSVSDTPTSLSVAAASFPSNDALQTVLTTVGSMLAISFSSSISEQSMLTTPMARLATTFISSGSKILLSTSASEVAASFISSFPELPVPTTIIVATSLTSGSQIILSTSASEVATSFISRFPELPVPTTIIVATSLTSGSQIVATSLTSGSQIILSTSVSEVAASFISSFPELPVPTTIAATLLTSGSQQPMLTSVRTTIATSFSSSSSQLSVTSPMDMVSTLPATVPTNSPVKISQALQPTVSVGQDGGPGTQKKNHTPVIIAVTVSVFFVGLIAAVGIPAMVVRRKKKRGLAFYDLNSGVDIHNPSYQGVTANQRTTSSGSYNMYASPDRRNPQKSETVITAGQHYEVMDSIVAPVTNTGRPLSSGKTAASKSERIYEIPAKDEELLHAQLKRIGIQHISADTVRISDHLGSGQFGVVSKGEWESPNGPVEVAVKTSSDNDNTIKLLQEATIMGQFSHPNIVQLHGMVMSRNLVMIVMELLTKGDLRKYLIALRPNSDNKADDYLAHTLLSFCRQIASGLSYLADKAFVHRDLSARNILVDADSTCKVADFGMSRDLMDEDYYTASAGRIPVKWTAPEALHFRKYSTASDVWSYGVLMYEIWSLGRKPFEGYSNHQIISVLDSGHRLSPPTGCPRAIYDIMIKCWHPTNCERPDAAMISQWLSRPDPQLLRWSEEDRAVHPKASLLGAELEAAVELYKELQETYRIKE